jgi:hypothetical protein
MNPEADADRGNPPLYTHLCGKVIMTKCFIMIKRFTMSFQRRLESSYPINSSYKSFHIDITHVCESLDSSLRWNDMVWGVGGFSSAKN